jgi:hypothetical protein
MLHLGRRLGDDVRAGALVLTVVGIAHARLRLKSSMHVLREGLLKP